MWIEHGFVHIRDVAQGLEVEAFSSMKDYMSGDINGLGHFTCAC